MSIFFVIPSAYHCLVIHKLANGDNFNKKNMNQIRLIILLLKTWLYLV